MQFDECSCQNGIKIEIVLLNKKKYIQRVFYFYFTSIFSIFFHILVSNF